MDKFRLIILYSELGTFDSVKQAKKKALEINPDVEFYLDRNSYKQGRSVHYATTPNSSMRIEFVPETREEKIQRWLRKIKKRIACQETEYKQLYDSDIAEDQKLAEAEMMADDLYTSVPEDVRDDVYEVLLKLPPVAIGLPILLFWRQGQCLSNRRPVGGSGT